MWQTLDGQALENSSGISTVNRLAYRKLRAPKGDGEILQEPPLSQFTETLSNNLRLIGEYRFQWAGQSLGEIQQMARRELVSLAAEYSGYGSSEKRFEEKPLILSGHQPTLFHSGVWFKNFALDSLAKNNNAIAINLIIDNDLSGMPAISVPTGTRQAPRLENVKYDSHSSLGPYETETLSDADLFESFADRVAKTGAPFVEQPLIKTLWPYVLESLPQTKNPAMAIAAGRHRFEQEFGIENLEIPLSRICQTKSFATFVAEMIRRAHELHSIYNLALDEYRIQNRIRSAAHPVPSLKQIDEWIELPFWIWTDQHLQRSPLFVSVDGDSIYLGDGSELRHLISGDRLVEDLMKLPDSQIQLRPRALMTTMYSRLALADAFLHGIGGAKYDQLTNQIMDRMFGIEPPEFNIVTGTFLLPLEMERGADQELANIGAELRNRRYHPERYVDSPELIANKKEQLASQPATGSKKAWRDQLDHLNRQMFELMKPDRQRLQNDLEKQQANADASKILNSREFSFCLFDESLATRLKDALI